MLMPVGQMGNEPVLLLQPPPLLLDQPANSTLLAQQGPLHLLEPLVEDDQLPIQGARQPLLFSTTCHLFATHWSTRALLFWAGQHLFYQHCTGWATI